MASEGVASENASTADSGQAPRTMVLHVLSPSLEAPNRLTFNDLPLTTTVAELKERISQSIPSRPTAEQQRLIYRGKPLLDGSVTLQNILEPSDAPVHSMHLVLPPDQTPSGSASAPAGSSTPVQDAPTGQTDPLRVSGPYPLRGYIQANQQVRFRGIVPRPSPGPNESEIELALRRNIEALRRQIEEQARAHQRQQGSEATVSSGRSYHLPTFQSVASPFAPSPSGTPQTPSSLAQATSRDSSSSTPTMPDSAVPGVPAGSNINADQTADGHATGAERSGEVEDRQLRLRQLQNNISLGENQLSRGIAPPLDSIAHIRNELYRLLDDQSRNPLAPRDGRIEALLARVLNLYVRADQLRVLQARSNAERQDNAANQATPADAAHAPVYLLSSPAGHEALIASPSGTAMIQSAFGLLRTQQAPASGPALRQDQAQGAPLNPGAVVMENAVRQALLNQRRIENNRQAALARNLRRIWLFVRLYFFCYLFSESGTWSRVIFVSLAVLISLLSETGLPQQFHRMVIAPVQRHLESLVHVGADEQVQPVPHGGVGANVPPDAAGNAQTAPVAAGGADQRRAGLQQSLRRLERSLALFFASLVPGVGERHVEARNAAQAAAERGRSEEEIRRRRQEAEQAAQQTANTSEPSGAQSPRGGSPEQNHADGNDTTIPQGDGVER